eukprot:CAMPEP_0195106574 /NCGR_PEP_ID=MMETSP0448-20130528/81286_1 /TAXON_ID=66468 /ORGANISM="Heterocapsa triquestra, Strain CCMP 448" /LENGTH=131 /DNA_ID=CAMNT_0040142859 /DNA_START=200 /DNA_END=595 /DNA_ORIENTATION=-
MIIMSTRGASPQWGPLADPGARGGQGGRRTRPRVRRAGAGPGRAAGPGPHRGHLRMRVAAPRAPGARGERAQRVRGERAQRVRALQPGRPQAQGGPQRLQPGGLLLRGGPGVDDFLLEGPVEDAFALQPIR